MPKKKVNLYRILKKKQEKRLNEVIEKYCFFAFSDKQFEEGMNRFGLSTDPADLQKVVRFYNGGFILKDHAEELHEALRRNTREFNEAAQDPETGDDFMRDAFLTELYNHEFSYTGDPSDAVEALGLTMEEVLKDERLNMHLAGAMQYIQEHVQE